MTQAMIDPGRPEAMTAVCVRLSGQSKMVEVGHNPEWSQAVGWFGPWRSHPCELTGLPLLPLQRFGQFTTVGGLTLPPGTLVYCLTTSGWQGAIVVSTSRVEREFGRDIRPEKHRVIHHVDSSGGPTEALPGEWQ